MRKGCVDRPDFIFGFGSVLALGLGDEATEPNLPGILDERPIGKQVNVEDLPSKFDNRVGRGMWVMSLVIATTGVCVVRETLRRAKNVREKSRGPNEIVKWRIQAFRARERRLAVDVQQVLSIVFDGITRFGLGQGHLRDSFATAVEPENINKQSRVPNRFGTVLSYILS